MTMTEERCKHEMLVDTCDMCKPRNKNEVSLFEGQGIPAKYKGRCRECGGVIIVGEYIVPTVIEGFERWVHFMCDND